MATPTNPGEVTVTINGKKYTLKSTLRAYRAINALGPGYNTVMEQVRAIDTSTITQIICFATGKLSDGEPEKMEQAIFENGVLSLVGPVSDYVLALSNGGKTADDVDSGGEEKQGNVASA